jgi:maltose alpha-D-glucosyltransferase/alpha-amylase
VTLHNFSDRGHRVRLKVGCRHDEMLVEVFNGRHSRAQNDGSHRINMEPYAWRWFRVGAADNTLDRSDLNLTPDKEIR